MRASIQEVVFDCSDSPSNPARFWADIFGARWAAMGDDWALVESTPIRVAFQRVPEEKVTKNRLHLDIHVEDAIKASEAAVAMGAMIITPLQGGPTTGCIVMADPWGKEFSLDPTKIYQPRDNRKPPNP
ncbi:MAG: VOC family protein [Dermabacter sp.]|nr:VOC family protein [Dermabacter sp.]